MCIAIVKTKGATISDEALRNSFERNSDGAGLAYSKDNCIRYVKGLFDVESFIKAVREAEKQADGAMLIHCRIGTSGLRDKENCHPHVISSHCVMIHNGVLNIDVPEGSKVSDSVIFARDYLRPLKDNFMKDKGIMKLIEMAIGYDNKLAFLNEKGEYAIVNEDAGNWVDGVWYSNDSYKERQVFKSSIWSGYNDYWGGHWNDTDEYDRYDEDDVKDVDTERVLCDEERLAIYQAIAELNDKQLEMLSEYPVYDMYYSKLKPDTDCEIIDKEYEYYLDDLDEQLYNAYSDKYYEMLERTEQKNLTDDDIYWHLKPQDADNILRIINELSPEDLEELGEFPKIDLKHIELVSGYSEKTASYIQPLYKANKVLFETYHDKYMLYVKSLMEDDDEETDKVA